MNKKIVTVGSICTVAILIGVSFTSVVGYSNAKSKVRESPLYTFRINRAIDNDKGVKTYDFVGKDKGDTLPFPIIDSRVVILQKFIDRIKEMDRESFNKFKTSIIQQFNNNQNGVDSYVLNIYNISKITNISTYDNYLCRIYKMVTTFLRIIGVVVLGIICTMISVLVNCYDTSYCQTSRLCTNFYCPTQTDCFENNN